MSDTMASPDPVTRMAIAFVPLWRGVAAGLGVLLCAAALAVEGFAGQALLIAGSTLLALAAICLAGALAILFCGRPTHPDEPGNGDGAVGSGVAR